MREVQAELERFRELLLDCRDALAHVRDEESIVYGAEPLLELLEREFGTAPQRGYNDDFRSCKARVRPWGAI